MDIEYLKKEYNKRNNYNRSRYRRLLCIERNTNRGKRKSANV